MLETEKPGTVYIPGLPATSKAGKNKKINASVSMWQKSYVKSRLARKCRERSIELTEVFGKGISSQCCHCGGVGVKEGKIFRCGSCGRRAPERQNTARNVLNRGIALNNRQQDCRQEKWVFVHKERIHGWKIREYFADGSRFGVHISYIEEETPLGSAGALFYLKNQVKDRDIILVYGDIMFALDWKRLIRFHEGHSGLITVLVHPSSLS